MCHVGFAIPGGSLFGFRFAKVPYVFSCFDAPRYAISVSIIIGIVAMLTVIAIAMAGHGS